ncbi:hypothetical protein CPB83DRAFT_788022 [Crepidotus variabilis]|uniref:Transmembrane protein 188 n=1 Tax=Crepidotus variabilis TaxID=179855 RepID=A0A9P6EKC5_9AGAR|nr:hypothetical protein CPB83DRAFT_788022 [Crepidotus variabilis]
MPSRSSPVPKRPFVVSNDPMTYRDLLLFEERLKSNAANLQRRKSRYQLFLLQLLIIITFLLCEVILPPQSSLLAIPYRFLLLRILPGQYNPAEDIVLHPYFASGLLFVSVTTLALFFASGMYSERIAYANKYVPHANRSLRAFNMYLNVRKPPLRSKFLWNPLSFFFPRPNPTASPVTGDPPRSPSPDRPRSRSASTTRPIQTIPPAKSPRGEIIFSSRVDKNFRESYERYRSAFERKREEKEFVERKGTWWGRMMFWERPPIPFTTPGNPPPPSRTGSISSRGRGSRPGTPGSPSQGHGGIMMKQRDRNSSPMRTGSPIKEKRPRRDRDRDTLEEADMRTAVLERSIGQAVQPEC